MSMREEFEKWAVGEGWETARSNFGERFYRSLNVQYMWEAWQAATRVELEACAQIARKASDYIEGAEIARAIRARGDQS